MMSDYSSAPALGMDEDAYYKRMIFLTDNVDKKMISTIEDLLKELDPTNENNVGVRYIDYAAQAAYLCYPDSVQQAAFVDLAAEQQADQILMAMLTYQEFMTMRASYYQEMQELQTAALAGDTAAMEALKKIFPESLDAYGNLDGFLTMDLNTSYNNYQNAMIGLMDGTGSAYGGIISTEDNVGALETWLSGKIYLDPNANSYIYLNDYFRKEDASGVTLTNTAYQDVFSRDYYIKECPYAIEDFVMPTTFEASPITKSMQFQRHGIVVRNPEGQATVKVFYILDGDFYDEFMELSTLAGLRLTKNSEIVTILPNTTYFNLARSTFTDSTGTVCALATAEDLKQAMSDSYYTRVGTPYGYLSSVLDYGAYKGSITGIRAASIDQTFYVCGVYQSGGQAYCTGVIAYSLAVYCMDQAENATGSLQDIAQLTAVYGYYANTYFMTL